MEYLSHLAKVPLIRGPTSREYTVYTFVIYSEEPLIIAQSAFDSVPLSAVTRRKESKNGTLPHSAVALKI